MKFKLPQLDNAYHWLCQQRKHFPANADIWHFRFHYPATKLYLLRRINAGTYRFSHQQKIIKANGQVIHLWGSQDALVMKPVGWEEPANPNNSQQTNANIPRTDRNDKRIQP